MSIVLHNLVKRFGSQATVDHVSLEIADGELFVLLGPSGSGKSTILRMIAGLTPVTEGRIVLHGRDVTDLTPQQRDTGFVFQNYSLFRHMTVADNIEFGLTIRKVSRLERVTRRDELLDIVGLAGLGHRYPTQLSGGQQQRVAVARALAAQPSVLLLDEPFGALDVKIRGQLRQSLREIQKRLGVTTILVTHDQEEAFELGDRIGVINHGRLLEVEAPWTLYRQPQTEFVATFLGSANLLAGSLEMDTIRLGPLSLHAPAAMRQLDREGRVEVLFRPEDLTIATDRAALEEPVLGAGVVESVAFLGSVHKIRVRLDPLPGTWPLPVRYGQDGVVLDIASLSQGDAVAQAQVGHSVWVGIQHYHVLPRVALRLLVAVDEATNTDALLQTAAWVGKRAGATLAVMSVAASQDKAEAMATQAQSVLAPIDPNIRVLVRTGSVVDELLNEVGRRDYDLVCLPGQTPMGAPWAALERLLREAPLPLLVVKGDRPAFKHVLLCSAGGEPGKLDIMFGARLARRASASATLLYVASPELTPSLASAGGVDASTTANPRINRHLEAGRVTLLGQGVSVATKIRQGAVADEILAEARQGDYDLIVVGGHLSPSPRRPTRDMAAQVVAQADRPVLVVRGHLG